MGRYLLVFALCLALGCRQQKGSDKNYEKAARLYQSLYASELDDAYGDPKMEEVVTLLKLVDHSSLDSEAAQTMLRAIDHGKEELVKSRAARERMGAAAELEARTAVTNVDPVKV